MDQEPKPSKTTISSVKRICETCQQFQNVDEIDNFVEAPLVPMAKELFLKGIKSISSNASTSDGQRDAHMMIQYKSLSDENKRIAKEILGVEEIKPGPWGEVFFKMDIDGNTPVEEVEKWGKSISSKFVKQPAIWETRYSIEQIKKWDESMANLNSSEIAKRIGFFLAEDGHFYRNEEAYKRYLG